MIEELPTSGALSYLLPLWSADPGPAARPATPPGATILVTVDAVRDDDSIVARLAAADISLLGYVDLAYATRPPAELRAEVAHLAKAPLGGVFLDRAPTTPYAIGPVALAVRSARRAGLHSVIVNPGLPADPVYNTLGAAMCTFEATWSEYRRMPDDEFLPGGGHLVHGVPPGDLPASRELMRRRRAAFGFATDRRAPGPYGLAGRPGALAAAR